VGALVLCAAGIILATEVIDVLKRGPVVVLMALCLLLNENFPFSHFPMSSSFSNYSYYVYISYNMLVVMIFLVNLHYWVSRWKGVRSTGKDVSLMNDG
jgi:hypothetical protein